MTAPAFDYDHARGLAQSADPDIRTALACNPDSPAEILYYLVSDEAVSVRRAVAANPATPSQADSLLAKDKDYGVRCELARKIVGHGLGGDQRSELWRMGFTILETLATDQIVRVRRVLAEALKHVVGAPKPIVTRLARDPDPGVATPILTYSPVLDQDDLVEIIEGDAADWTKAAIASRDDVGAGLADAIAAHGPVPAIASLLGNKRSAISDPTIIEIADRARDVEEWHEPLVVRPHLPAKAALRLARFVAGPLLSILQGRKDLDLDPAKELGRVAEDRGETRAATSGGDATANSAATEGTPAERAAPTWEAAEDRALRLHGAGSLTDEAVELALDLGENDFVVAAIALRSGIALSSVRYILESESAKAVTALCWKAGHKMRFALDVQKRLSHIQPGRLIYARDGFEYPLSDEEMAAQLHIFCD